MNRRLFLIAAGFGAITSACTASDQHGAARKPAGQAPPQGAKAGPGDLAARASHEQGRDAHGHDHPHSNEVPAFETSPAALKSLPATLPPEQFAGKQRLGYEAARAIPQTIAQLPCYCHCDKGFGHKSLHTCFVDDHAAHCAVCIDEALMAYKMEREEKLKPEQIRQRIIAHYGAQN
jgi:hypothetical protein